MEHLFAIKRVAIVVATALQILELRLQALPRPSSEDGSTLVVKKRSTQMRRFRQTIEMARKQGIWSVSNR